MKISTRIFVSLFLAALFAGLTACTDKKDDARSVSANIAMKTLLGTYVHSTVDSAAMNLTVREWKLENGDAGQTGYFRQAYIGNDVDSKNDFSKPLLGRQIWRKTISLCLFPLSLMTNRCR